VSENQILLDDKNKRTGRVTGTLLELSEITKAFPGIIANDSINLDVLPGEIHALVGENGAGKSTLVKIIYGLLRPDSGAIYWNGYNIDIAGPAKARSLGIGMVFQHFSLFESLTVLENTALSIDKKGDISKLRSRILEVSKVYGLALDPDRHIHSLSVGERQRVEIVRCLLQSPKLLILDEPTSVLTPQESESLFATLELLSREGCAILYISHKLREIQELCTSATILRRGKVVANCDPSRETIGSMAEMMIGEGLPEIKRKWGAVSRDPRIVVKDLSSRSVDPFGVNLKSISFTVKGGEVLGVAGVAGNGQTELMAALSGEDNQLDPSSIIKFDNQPVMQMKPAARRALGVGFIPEQRLGHAAISEMTLAENTLLTASKSQRMENRGFIDKSRVRPFAEQILSTFDVRAGGIDAEAASLSGGNVQKFIVGREILQNPGILVIAQPTWGVDVGAAMVLRRSLIKMAARGCAVLIISQDLDEIFEICSRITVIAQGNLSQIWDIDSVSVEQIGLLMGGK
tara:strand:+ start:1631 stop:3184 length:1554 start_codon:yes stop_codon:yes gene_type:complete